MQKLVFQSIEVSETPFSVNMFTVQRHRCPGVQCRNWSISSTLKCLLSQFCPFQIFSKLLRLCILMIGVQFVQNLLSQSPRAILKLAIWPIFLVQAFLRGFLKVYFIFSLVRYNVSQTPAPYLKREYIQQCKSMR